jgi:dTDP-4-dehydrorhamnose reductase
VKVGVTGAGGLLGTTLVPLWRAAGADVTAWDRAALDVTDAAAVDRAVGGLRPDVLVHAAAWTDVDGAEAQPDAAMRANRDGTAAVAAACAASGALLVHLSTDYVFDGRARTPIPPGTPSAPLGAYGRSKAAAESAARRADPDCLIVRTGWVFGPGGRNFVDTMRDCAAQRCAVRVVDDQVGAPTSTRLLAEALWALVAAGARGVMHVASAGSTTWHGVAAAVYAAAGAPASLVTPCTSAEAARPAPRPAYGVLDCTATARTIGLALPGWEGQVHGYVRDGVVPPCGILRESA